MGKKDRLKNGLDSLFEDNFNDMFEDRKAEKKESKSGDCVRRIRISMIEPDRNQPRKNFDEEKLSGLADNIREIGVIQPIIVRESDDERYTIIAGERRWRAARLAGFTEIPAIVKKFSDIEIAQIAIIENVQREDLSPLEEAAAYKRLADEFSMTQEKIAEKVGKSRAAVSNLIRLLSLPENVKKALDEKKISVGHAKILCGIQDVERVNMLLENAVENSMSVREFEALVNNGNEGKKKKSRAVNKKSDKLFVEIKCAMHSVFGHEPDIKKKADGKVVLNMTFKNEDEINEFMRKLTMENLGGEVQ